MTPRSRTGLVLLLAAAGSLAPRWATASAGDTQSGPMPPPSTLGASALPPEPQPPGAADARTSDTPGPVLPTPASPGSPPPSPSYPTGPAYPSPPPPTPQWLPPAPRRYGDQGTPEFALGFGYGSSTGLLAAGGFRYFVVDTLAPGVEATYVSGGAGGTAYGMALGALRFVPFRTTSMALVVTGRGGRMFVAHHDDGWAVGGGLGIILMMSSSVGFELGYEALRLEPSSFCADLRACTISGVALGLRIIP